MTNNGPRYWDLRFLESAKELTKTCSGPHSSVTRPIAFGIWKGPRELEVRTDAYCRLGAVLPRLDSDACGLLGSSELADRGTEPFVQSFTAYSADLFWN